MNENLQQLKELVLSSVHVGKSDYPIAILPSDMKIHSLESQNQFRNQFRAVFSTYNFDSFTAYAAQYQQENAQCFIDEKNLGAEIVFDIGSLKQPLHANHRAPPLAAVQSLDSRCQETVGKQPIQYPLI